MSLAGGGQSPRGTTSARAAEDSKVAISNMAKAHAGLGPKSEPPRGLNRKPRRACQNNSGSARVSTDRVARRSSSLSASMMSSQVAALPSAVRRSAGFAVAAQASEAQDASMARFSFSVRSGSSTTSKGWANARAGCRRSSNPLVSNSLRAAPMTNRFAKIVVHCHRSLSNRRRSGLVAGPPRSAQAADFPAAFRCSMVLRVRALGRRRFDADLDPAGLHRLRHPPD